MPEMYWRRNWIPLLGAVVAGIFATLAVVATVTIVTDDGDEEAHGFASRDASHGASHDAFHGGDLRARLAEHVDGPVLGVTVAADDGALRVQEVLPGSAAAEAGMRRGDELRKVAGKRVESVADVRAALATVDGSDYPVELRRDDESLTIEVANRGAFTGFADLFGAGGLFGGLPSLDGEALGSLLGPLMELLFGSALGSESEEYALPPQLEGLLGELLAQPEVLGRLLDAFGSVDPGESDGDGLAGLFADLFGDRSDRGDGRGPRYAPDGGSGRPQPVPPRPVQPPPMATPAPVTPPTAPPPTATPPAVSPVAPAVKPLPPTSAVQLVPEVYFGRIAALDAGSITLTGELGPITLALGPQTEVLGVGPPRVGGLATAVVVDGAVTLLVVIV